MTNVLEKKLTKMLEEAASFSEKGAGVTRLFLTNEHKKFLDWLENYAKKQNLLFYVDDSGNGRIIKKSTNENAKILYLGSHQDTVKEGGKYDGVLGVLLPLVALETLNDLPFDVEVIAFGDEEGTRFGSTLVGSTALAGCFDKTMLQRTDAHGISMSEALKNFGLNPDNIDSLAVNKQKAIGFLEVHIEQGPVLEANNLPVGNVSAMTGIERHQVTVIGSAGHAGTTPMHLRNDALISAAKIVLIVEELCKTTNELVGVVGKLNVFPNAVNVISGRVDLTIELRSPKTSIRELAREQLFKKLKEIDGIEIETIYQQEGIQCDEKFQTLINESIKEEGIAAKTLFSGAGHDGLAMSKAMPSAMLFMRCKNGLSHHPNEAILEKDSKVAIAVLQRCLLKLATE